MPTYYDHGLGIDTTSQITSSGDELAAAANYIEPENVDYAHYTWENQPISKTVALKTRDEDFPQLSSPLIYITIPSGSPHIIYDSTNTVLISGNADENNDRDFTLDYSLTGATIGSDDITADTVWSFTTPVLDFGSNTIRTNIVSDMGPTAYDSVIVSRTPTLLPVITVTTPTTAPTATTVYDEMDIGGTAVDPNSFPIQRVDYTATAPGDTVYTQYFGLSYWVCLANCSWTGSAYHESGPGMSIRPVTGSWYVGFRPDYIRVTVDSSYTFKLNDNTGAAVVNLPVTSGVNTLPITWLGNDLGPSETPSWLGRISNASGDITNIEFGSAGVGTDEGARATGTDNWDFTVPLIVGDTTVNVIGSNTWSLSGSDSIVVTRTPALNPVVTITTPTTGTSATVFYDTIDIGGTAVDPNPLPITSVVYTSDFTSSDNGFLYDEFDDASLDPRWNRESGSGSTAEQNDRLEITCQSEAAYFFGQDFSEETIDVWGKLEAGFTPTEGTDLGYTLRFRLRDENSLDYVWIGLKWNAESSPGEYWEVDGRHWEQGVGFHAYFTGDISQDFCWVRVKWQSGQSYIRIFYSLTEPVVEDDWTEFVPTTWFPVFSDSDFSFEFVTGTDQPGDRIGYGWNAIYLQPSSQKSGTATGTDNWNFTVPLNLGSLDVDVTGINSYSASGSDSIVITRAIPQNPIVTITTETTGASALQMTVEGTASDPNNFTLTKVSFVTIADIIGDTVQYFDNTRWQDGGDAGTFIWSGSQWDISSGGVNHSLASIGAWSSGYRPLSIILNGGPFADTVTVKDTNGDTIGSSVSYTSGEELDLTFGDYDIGTMICANVDSNQVITNIRFVEADTTTGVDSGDATGTTNWTFDTMLSSAGNNTITVTAVDNYSPPLSGSDTLIVTYSAPSQYDQMFYDNFGDGSLDPTWSVTGSTNVVEAGGYLTFNSAADDGLDVRQTLTVNTDFDVYGQVKLDTQNNTVISFTWRQSFLPSGLQSAELRLERNSGLYDIRYTFYDGAGSDTGTVDNIGQDNCWFRTRYRPSQGDTELRLFYSLTTPTLEGHWTEFSSPTRSVIPDPAELDPIFLMESVSDEFASSTQIIYDAIEWTG